MSSNQVAVVNEVRQSIERMAPQFKAALPAHIPVERFVRTTLTAVQTNPALLEADRRTLYAAATRAAQMGLLPDGREGAIVTFKGQAQWMPMVAGLQKLIRNSGELASLDAQIVCKNDKFTYRPGIDAVPVHEPDWFGDRGETIGVYAVARMKDGAAYCEIMNMKQLQAIRGASRSGNGGPWGGPFADEMMRKSVIRRLAKRLPMSTDIDGAIHEDDELFAPPAETPVHTAANGHGSGAEQAQDAPAPEQKRRGASRLAAVAKQAPAERVTEDGEIIDMESNPPAPIDDDGDSPI